MIHDMDASPKAERAGEAAVAYRYLVNAIAIRTNEGCRIAGIIPQPAD